LSTGNPPAGYYADPSVPGYIRYWDGNEWVAGTSRPAPEELAEQGAAQSPAQSSDPWQPEPTGNAAGQAQQRQQGLIQSGARQYGGQGRHSAGDVQRVAQAPQMQAQAQQPQSQPQQYARVPQQAQAPTPAPSSYAPTPAPVPTPTPTPSYAPTPTPTPTPAPTPQQPQPGAVVQDEIPESVATMIVPSAFVHSVRNGGGYSFTGQNSNPFAGLPGSEFVAAEEKQGATETKLVELASPGSRFLARIIDLGIGAVFSAPVTITLLLIAHRHDHQYVLKLDTEATTTYTTLGMDGLGIALWAGALLALVIASVVYEGYRLGRDGQTIGKRLAGVRVVGLPDGLPLGKGGVGMRRALLFWVFAIIPVVDVVALGSVFWGRPYRQGAHEKATSTATVKA
jgi:hypothetical protein